MNGCLSCIVWGAAWCLAGIAVLVVVETAGGRNEPRALTVGDLLLFMAVGAPFLPLVLLTLLCQVRLPPIGVRKRAVRQQQPDYRARAAAERETAAAEVEGWLSR